MAHARSFSFDSYNVHADKRTLSFNYRINFEDELSIRLTEQLKLPIDIPVSHEVIRKLLAALHIGLGMSYYKMFLPASFDLNDRELSAPEADFWNSVYLNGLAEFFYANKLDPAQLAKFSAGKSTTKASPGQQAESALLAIGGGKDSIVAGELLRSTGINLTGYVLGTGAHQGQSADVTELMGLELLAIDRRLDPKLLELNTRTDVYNGHIPISMVFALAGLLLCASTAKKYLIVSNEASASIPNTEWKGMMVNHQWSKSFEFERALQDFIHTTVSPDLWYFSAVRPLSSVAIAKLFAQQTKYFNHFTSCNRVFAIDPAKRPKKRWCGECAKCLSSFIILAPWIEQDALINMFGKNMLDDRLSKDLFLALTGLEGHKPLDCVGTVDEMVLSLNLAANQDKFIYTSLMHIARERGIIRTDDWDSKLQMALAIGNDYSFPPELKEKLLDIMKANLA